MNPEHRTLGFEAVVEFEVFVKFANRPRSRLHHLVRDGIPHVHRKPREQFLAGLVGHAADLDGAKSLALWRLIAAPRLRDYLFEAHSPSAEIGVALFGISTLLSGPQVFKFGPRSSIWRRSRSGSVAVSPLSSRCCSSFSRFCTSAICSGLATDCLCSAASRSAVRSYSPLRKSVVRSACSSATPPLA